MDNCRRSGRSRKTINYAKFAEDSDDDDFKESNMPVSKKQKADKGYSPEDNGRASRKSSDKKEKAKVKDETKKSEGKKESSPRLPVTEKVFQRDLQTALERSKQDGEGKDESSEESNEEEEEKVSSGPKYDVKRGNHTNKSESAPNDEEEDDEDEDESEEEEVQDWDSQSEEESDWSNDDVKGKKAKTKEEENKTKKTNLPQNQQPIQRKTEKTFESKNSHKPKVNNACVKKPLNLPPSKLRLGLSRKAVIKSLHPQVTAQL
ncbi:RAD51-associated protein 1-like [Centruroides vittatus]|uniref:RAD51-associated protein 1-like n=1 Tax=Centruroides vittatus TaxID=120091 RepID=UPI003510B95F